MQQINLLEAAEHLTELAEAAINGETVVIMLDDQRSVQIVPVEGKRRVPRKAGSAAGQITFSDDFDAPLPDFDEYMP
jgi:antitoxin (DNA-binding transcriptional repressor) of toxin-antitoxin stability system